MRATVVGAAVALCAACASTDSSTSHAAGSGKKSPPVSGNEAPRIATGRVGEGLALRDNRVEAFPGRTLIVPVGPEADDGGAARSTPPGWTPGDVPEVALVTNEPLETSVWRITGTADPEFPGALPWSGVFRHWSALPLAKVDADAESDPADIVIWVLAIEMPDRPVGKWLRVGGRKLPLEWVPTPTRKVPAPLDLRTVQEDGQNRILRMVQRFGAESVDPFRGWRYRLLYERMPVEILTIAGDEILEDLSRQMMDRALAAIDRIRAADPALADRTLGALTAIVDAPDHELLPAWPPDPAPALELFSSVLREGRSDADVRADTEAFLRTAPQGLAWIVDEAGPDGPSTAPTCRIGIAERWGQEATASLAPLGMNASNAVAIKPFASAVLSVDPGFPGPIRTATVTARLGTWSSEMRILAGSVGAKPPGVTLGPLMPDWTQSTWVRGVQPKIPADAVTVAMLQRQYDATGVPVGWEMIIEAQRTSKAPGDEVTVWIGPMGATTAAIRVTPEGDAAIIVGDLTGENLNVAINTSESRWIAQFTIPPELIAIPRIRIGIDRTDASGLHSAWPRPSLPGQQEPGRIAVDLTSW